MKSKFAKAKVGDRFQGTNDRKFTFIVESITQDTMNVIMTGGGLKGQDQLISFDLNTTRYDFAWKPIIEIEGFEV